MHRSYLTVLLVSIKSKKKGNFLSSKLIVSIFCSNFEIFIEFKNKKNY